jgi:hypothetical protein
VFDTIVRGGRVVSGSLERINRGDSFTSHRHHVVFCSSDAVLVGAFNRFIAGALHEENVVIVAVSEAHERSLQRSLRDSHVDLALAIRQKRYVPVNIGELLANVMVNGFPDPTRFVNATRDLVTEAAQRATGHHAGVVACGECAATVWADGQVEAAIQLERLWDEMAKRHQMDILCAYPLATRKESVRTVKSLCAEHTAVEIS